MSASHQSLPVLYSFRRCPYAIRARLALRYAGIGCELREVILKNKPAEMLQASPKGTVPVLVLNKGAAEEAVIAESLDIMLWALRQHDPAGWLDVELKSANQLITANDDHFKPWLDRYKYPDRYSDVQAGEPRRHCEKFLAELETRLGQSACLCGERVSLADMAIYSFVRQYAFVNIEEFRAGPFTAVNRWLETFLNSALFGAVMDKYPAWQAGDEMTVF